MNLGMNILGVVSPGMLQVAMGQKADLPLTKTLAPGLAAGILGFALVPAHPVLAFFGGEVLGQNAYRLYRGQGTDRTRALSNIGVIGAMIGGSLVSKQHPFWGGAVGFVVGLLATSLVPGSNANTLLLRYKR